MNPRFDLTILIRTLSNRTDKLKLLVDKLSRQSIGLSVQILWLGDNKSMTTGEKANHLKSMSKGVYSCFVDDDDDVSTDYIKSIFESITSGKKVLTFEGEQYSCDRLDLPFIFGNYSMNHRGEYKGRQYRRMIPNHLCAWHHSIFHKEQFPDINVSEDHRWAESMQKHYTKDDIHHIDSVLYTYKYCSLTSETRGK
jgi:hypothetical protein